MFGDGSSERDYTYIDDIVDGVEGALDYLTRHPDAYDIVNLGGARTTSLRGMIDQLADALGIVPVVHRMSDQPGDVRRTYADVSRAERLFGYRPTTRFETGIRRFADWFLSGRATASRLAAV